MNPDDLERLLGDSFDRQARASVPDRAAPAAAALRRTDAADPPPPARWLAPLAAAAVVIAVVAGSVVLGRDTSTPATTPTTAARPQAVPVQVRLLNTDGSTVGVGMPVVAYFSKPITDAAALSRATELTVDGKPAQGAWYFERSRMRPGFPIEGHFRMQSYWPARAKVALSLPIHGLPAGGNYAFADDLSLNFATAAAQVVTVDDGTHELTVRRDGRTVDQVKVSLGASATPTKRGVKVIMDKGRDIAMRGPGYYDAHVQWTQQLTYSGEYLHAAPWNLANIDRGADTSNGCTNLTIDDARRLFSLLRVGDVVEYPNATGPAMTLADGLGDWNLSWAQWLTGGALPTR